MKVFCFGRKGQKPVYSLEALSASEMSVLRCALECYRSKVINDNSSDEYCNEVQSVIDDFLKVVVEK